MAVFGWALIGYACGTFPSTWIVATRRGRRDVLDAVQRFAGGADAHVVLQRVAGRAAALAAALDVLKAFTPVILATRLAGPYAIAACAIGTVAGHCWPPYLSRYAGRGLAAASGAFLGYLPLEMVVAGIVRVVGSRLKAGGFSSTIGFVAIPLIGWWRGQPLPYLVAAGVINVMIFVRRLEGISIDVRSGKRVFEAAWQRVIFDAS
jgi:glycerol-3-phosphate acyltransferase PlsY